MAITFYYGSGSPPAWRVWLALEHKKLSYEMKLLSFSSGDLKKPEYLALNPRGKIPTIVDDGFVLYESTAIVEYLDQRYAESGDPLFPRHATAAAIARRVVQEVDNYFVPANSKLLGLTIFSPKGPGAPEEIAKVRQELISELGRFESYLEGDFFAGTLSAADYTLYTSLALARRVDRKMPEHGISAHIGPKLSAWAKRIEALPYFEKTTPPHWKE